MRMTDCRRRALRGAALLHALALASLAVVAQSPATVSPGGIYTCTDERGRKITSDRPIPDCNAREQRILNKDGSLKAVHPPTLTSDERAEAEARERTAAEARAAQADAVRRDRNLVVRFRTQDAHNAARMAALDSVRAAMRLNEKRIAELARERKPLVDEAEFYKGRPLPAKLKTQMDANDAAAEALRESALTQEAELERINTLYDAELARLKRLWTGAPAGSLGPLPPSLAPTKAAKADKTTTAPLP
jgi:head-tail adaptor